MGVGVSISPEGIWRGGVVGGRVVWWHRGVLAFERIVRSFAGRLVGRAGLGWVSAFAWISGLLLTFVLENDNLMSEATKRTCSSPVRAVDWLIFLEGFRYARFSRLHSRSSSKFRCVVGKFFDPHRAESRSVRAEPGGRNDDCGSLHDLARGVRAGDEYGDPHGVARRVAKNTAYATVAPQVRAYAQQIANNAGVASADKIALGLNPKTSTPSAITPPSTTPILSVQSASAGSIILRYRDSAASPSVKSKPYGVVQCQIAGAVSATPITDPTVLNSLALATKSPFILPTSGLLVGGTLYLAATWNIRKGARSGFSPIISTTVV